MNNTFQSQYTFFDPTTLKVGNHTFTLKKVVEQVGHDDTLPYAATLYIDNKRVAIVFNDGWGGETQYHQIFNKDLLEKAEKEIKGLPYPITPLDVMDIPLTINNVANIADIIAENTISLQLFYKRKKECIIGVIGCKLICAPLPQYVKNITNENSKKEMIEQHCKRIENSGYKILSAPHIIP